MTVHGWHVWWACWFAVSFFSFLTAETIALIQGKGGTLSGTIWWLEGWKSGRVDDFRNVGAWTAGHFLIGGALFVVLLWLIGHFVWHLWAG